MIPDPREKLGEIMQGIGILAQEIEAIVVGFADLRIEQIERVANAERDAIEQNAAEYREMEKEV